jgi:hypothetical protein
MQRRSALAFAGAAAVVVATGAAAIAANLGALGSTAADGGVGTLDARSVAELAPATASPSSVVVGDAGVVVTPTQPTAAPLDDDHEDDDDGGADRHDEVEREMEGDDD